MTTQCTEGKLIFHDLDVRDVVGRFDGGELTSDASAVLLREVDKRIGLLGRMSACFEDGRAPERIEHTVDSPVALHRARLAYTVYLARFESCCECRVFPGAYHDAKGAHAACSLSSPIGSKTHTCRSARRSLHSQGKRAISHVIYATFG